MQSPSATLQDELDAEILAVTEGQQVEIRSPRDLSDTSSPPNKNAPIPVGTMQSISATFQDDLDAEILAITGGKQVIPRSPRDLSDDSSSCRTEYDGISDSEALDDHSDRALIDSDEDGEDNDFVPNDGQDEGYSSTTKSRNLEEKSSFARKISQRRSRLDANLQSKPKAASLSDDEEEFVHKYDEDGYVDDDDRKALADMNEFSRERLLADRLEERTKELYLWNMKREIIAGEGRSTSAKTERKTRTSGRNKVSPKSDATQALTKDKYKGDPTVYAEISDTESETDSRLNRNRKEDAWTRKEPKQSDDGRVPLHDATELLYADLVQAEKDHKKATCLFLPRGTIIDLSQRPYFARIVIGLYARIKIADSTTVGSSYLLCRIVDVETGMPYSLTSHLRTNHWLVLQIGEARRHFRILDISASTPSENEFEVYRNRTLERGYELPCREEIEKLKEKTRALLAEGKIVPTEEEKKSHIQNTELLYPSRINWTLKMAVARTDYDIKLQELAHVKKTGNEESAEKLQGEIKKLQKRLKRIEKNQSLYGAKPRTTSDNPFQSLAERNSALNESNGEIFARCRKLEKNDGGVDQFARLNTTGQSYYFIRRKRRDEFEASTDIGRKREVDWRECLETWGKGKKRKISGCALDPRYAIDFEGLDDFHKDPSDEDSSGKKVLGSVPCIDAAYAGSRRRSAILPSSSKVVTFDQWRKQTTG